MGDIYPITLDLSEALHARSCTPSIADLSPVAESRQIANYFLSRGFKSDGEWRHCMLAW